MTGGPGVTFAPNKSSLRTHCGCPAHRLTDIRPRRPRPGGSISPPWRSEEQEVSRRDGWDQSSYTAARRQHPPARARACLDLDGSRF